MGPGNQKCYHGGITCKNMESKVLPENENYTGADRESGFFVQNISSFFYM